MRESSASLGYHDNTIIMISVGVASDGDRHGYGVLVKLVVESRGTHERWVYDRRGCEERQRKRGRQVMRGVVRARECLLNIISIPTEM